MTDIQTFIAPGGEEMVILTKADYLRLVEAVEDRIDAADAARILRAVAEGRDELVPDSVVKRIVVDGEHPLRVWREHRGMTLQELAAAMDMSVPYLSMIETGKRTNVSAAAFRLAAEALRVDVDDLIP
jgi:DNA-binding Xre family transcriptional regulator